MKNNLFCISIALLFIGCNPEIIRLEPKACFNYSPASNLKTNDTIKFSNCSVNSNYNFWDFGDGGISYEKDPKHVFMYKKSYKVKLFIANGPTGNTLIKLESDTVSKFITIDKEVPKADFNCSILGGFKMSFSNSSLYSNNYFWDFGDGTSSTESNPIHFFNSGGPYKVKLIASDNIQSDSLIRTISMNEIVFLNKKVETLVDLDVDGDGVADFQIEINNFFSITIQTKYSTIIPLNNYEISIDTAFLKISNLQEKFLIPRIYVIGDKISILNIFSNKSLYISEFLNGDGYLRGTLDLNVWNKDEIRYIGFRKVTNKRTKIGWIKLKVIDYVNVTLFSYKIPVETESLIINK